MPAQTSSSSKAGFLEKSPLFAGLSPRELAQVSRLMDEAEVPAGKRLATIGEAVTPMRLLILKYREFWQLLDESLPMTRKIMRTLSRRLRQAERWTAG